MGDGGPRRLFTDGGPLPVETLVIAAGAWSHRLTAQLGTRVPLEAERGYHLMLPRPGVALRIPLVDRDHNFTMTPMDCGLRLGGTAEFAGVDAPPDYRRARILLEHGRRAFPGLNGEGATEWMGCRPSLPDGLPIIDRSPRFANVFFAFGHAHFGLTEAPTTGKLIAEMIGGRPTSIDMTPFRVARFFARRTITGVSSRDREQFSRFRILIPGSSPRTSMALAYEKIMSFGIPDAEQHLTRTRHHALRAGRRARRRSLRHEPAQVRLREESPGPADDGDHPGLRRTTGTRSIRSSASPRTHTVHGEQGFRIMKPLPVEGDLVGKTRVTGVFDKGEGKGALIMTENTVRDKARPVTWSAR